MKIMKTILLSQADQEAEKLAKTLKGGEILALSGDLGSGKTTFTKALGKALGVRNTITSPTFVMMQEYQTGNTTKSKEPVWLYHLDLYRTKDYKDVVALGIEHYWGHPQTITVIEWAEKIQPHLPKKRIDLKFKRDEN